MAKRIALSTPALAKRNGRSTPALAQRMALSTLALLGVLGSASLLQAKAPPGRYKTLENGTIVHDTVTGLWWSAATIDNLSQADAKAACSKLTLGKVSGFKLPGRDQLITLIDLTASAADSKKTIDATRNYAIDMSVFTDAAIHGYWSSTLILTDFGSEPRYWAVGSERGDVFDAAGSEIHPVRCVRLAQVTTP